jgi:hypothetical protein
MFLPQEQRKVRARRVKPVVAFTTESSELKSHAHFQMSGFKFNKVQMSGSVVWAPGTSWEQGFQAWLTGVRNILCS